MRTHQYSDNISQGSVSNTYEAWWSF